MPKKDSAYFQNGENRCSTVFIFSCPGSVEEYAEKPVSGLTGAYLNMALEYLNKKAPEKFPWPCKTHYKITNAWDRVEYKEKTRRTQADNAQIIEKDNINRLIDELKGAKTIIACGNKAQLALRAMYRVNGGIKDRAQCASIVHLSGRALHRRYPVNGSTSGVCVLKRIQKWSEDVLIQVRIK